MHASAVALARGRRDGLSAAAPAELGHRGVERAEAVVRGQRGHVQQRQHGVRRRDHVLRRRERRAGLVERRAAHRGVGQRVHVAQPAAQQRQVRRVLEHELAEEQVVALAGLVHGARRLSHGRLARRRRRFLAVVVVVGARLVKLPLEGDQRLELHIAQLLRECG